MLLNKLLYERHFLALKLGSRRLAICCAQYIRIVLCSVDLEVRH